MRKNTKKMTAALMACILVGAPAVGGTIAYLTDGETVTNTFTVGKVQLDLTEPNKPDEDTPRVPNEEMKKDPTVQNTGNNDSVFFVAFDIPMDYLVTAGYDGTKQAADHVELFDFRGENGDYDSVNDGWVQIARTAAADQSKVTYIYGYENVVSPAETVPSVFDYVRMTNIVEGQIDGTRLNLPVRAYAVQSDFLQNAENGGANSNIAVGNSMSKDTLTEIYQIFAGQNPDAVSGDGEAGTVFTMDDADEAGKLNLSGMVRP